MKLTEPLKQKLLNRLGATGFLDRSCPVCGKRNWRLSDRVLELREYHRGGIVVGGDQTLIPIIVAFCQECGAMIPFNALVLGIVEQKTGLLFGEEEKSEAPK